MDTNRQHWNQGHQKLQRALAANDHHYSPGVLLEKAIEIFLDQHAMVHSANMAKSKLWSFEDEVLNDTTHDQIRCIPPQSEHPIAWILFHLARIENITMNLLVAGTPQFFIRDHWPDKLNVSIRHSANSMDDRDVATLSA